MVASPTINYGQAPNLGSAANFVLFSTVGAVSNTGISQLTGNVGSNSGATTGFSGLSGAVFNTDIASAQCSADLLIAYNQLNSDVPTTEANNSYFTIERSAEKTDWLVIGTVEGAGNSSALLNYSDPTRGIISPGSG